MYYYGIPGCFFTFLGFGITSCLVLAHSVSGGAIGMLEGRKDGWQEERLGILYYLLPMIPRDCSMLSGMGEISVGHCYLYLRRK
ncbi:hypothetical protein FPQ18DRAFT_61879 [Pyronema domesticum]|nr:hypothetical protein FPQ18DRAFT_61879 [Pyronema domesticum]